MSTAVLNRSDRRRPEAAQAADWSIVNDVYNDAAPARALHRRAVLHAVIACAAENNDRVHASTVRPLIPEWVDENIRGNVMSHLSRAGILGKTGRYLPSGQKRNRNAAHGLPEFVVLDWARLEAEAAA